MRDAAAPPDWRFSGSYDPQDVIFLLQPAVIAPTSVEEKEHLIQSGKRHYSEMLSAETVPDDRYLRLYHAALKDNAARLRHDISALADAIRLRPQTAEQCTVISLARAGTPVGVLLTRALRRRGVTAQHYSISIIRGRGIDEAALAYIAQRHGTESAIFVDGWTGKGAIRGELERSLSNSVNGFSPFLVVVADPAGVADLAATSDDYAIPSGLLNGIVSGLVSRSVLNDALVASGAFHACMELDVAPDQDLSRAFIAAVEAAEPWSGQATAWTPALAATVRVSAQRTLANIAREYGVTDINRIKPGIAEATRAILRRVPERVILSDTADPAVSHIQHLAATSGVPVEQRALHGWRAITIIRDVGGEQA